MHEYGGGAFAVFNNAVFFTNFNDQGFYEQKSLESSPEALFPKNLSRRYADGEYHAKVRFISQVLMMTGLRTSKSLMKHKVDPIISLKEALPIQSVCVVTSSM